MTLLFCFYKILFLISYLCLSFAQCANAVEATSRQMVALQQGIQAGLLRQAAHSLLGNYGAAPSQGKSPAKAKVSYLYV